MRSRIATVHLRPATDTPRVSESSPPTATPRSGTAIAAVPGPDRRSRDAR